MLPPGSNVSVLRGDGIVYNAYCSNCCGPSWCACQRSGEMAAMHKCLHAGTLRQPEEGGNEEEEEEEEEEGENDPCQQFAWPDV
eukprot:8532036-Pyramimonas_sp.AAC.1